MVRNIGEEFGYRKSTPPDQMWSCVGQHALTKYIIIAWSGYGQHEMAAAELSHDVESKVQASAASAREFR